MADRRGRGRGDSKQPKQSSLTGSGRRVRLDAGAAAIRFALGTRETWQEENWAYYDSTPEAKHAVIYTGNAMAKIRLFPAAWPADAIEEGDPIPATDPESDISPALAAAALDELRRLRSELGGQGEILRLVNMNLEVAGECFLVYRGPREEQTSPLTGKVTQEPSDESWNVHSISEVAVTQGGKVSIKVDGGGRGVPLEPDKGDQLVRIWLRHPRWSNRADCAMRGVLTELRILQSLSNEVLGTSQAGMSRGPFRVPNGLLLARGRTDAPDGDTDEDPLLEALSRGFTEPVGDPDSEFVVDYVYVKGDKEDLSADVFGPLPSTEQPRLVSIEERIDKHARRFARGINLPVEVVEGHMATTFSNAEQIDQDTFDDYHEPRARQIVDALTVALLRPNLLAREGMEGEADAIARLVVWYDPGDLIRQPDAEAAADTGAREGYISAAAWRAAKGYTEDDAPDALELIIRTGLNRGIFTAELTADMIRRLAEEAGIDLLPADELLEGATAGGSGQAAQFAGLVQALLAQEAIRRAQQTEEAAAADRPALARVVAITAAARSRAPLGQRLQQIDTHLLTRLHVASSASMDRALERAGNWLRSHISASNRALVASCPAREVAARLGPAIVADALGDDDDPFGDAWTGLGTSFMSWVEQAQAQAREMTSVAVDIDTEAVEQTQAAEAAAAWTWMAAELRTLAQQRLFDPDPAIEPGEADPTLRVPSGLVRQAIARAGGSGSLAARGPDGGYVTTAGEGIPAGGVATGETIMGALRDAGAEVGQFTWVYGAARPNGFEPHEDLDGLVFDSYEDPALANTDSWPPFPFFFPFDHVGCQCWIAPSIDVPAQAVSGRV